MAVFGQLDSSLTVLQIQQKFSVLFAACEDLERAYQWISQNSLADLEGPPLNWTAGDAQDIMNALTDFNDWFQTGQGTAGFPLPSLPYDFLTSAQTITGPR